MDEFSQDTTVSAGYGLLRGLLRWWLSTRFRKVRLLHAEGVVAAAAPIVVAGHPASFLDALILIAAFEAPVRCLVPLRLLRGAWRNFLARNFGMIGFEAGIEAQAFERCSDALAAGDIVAVFAEPPAAGSGDEAGRLGAIAAGLAVQAESREAGSLGVTVFPAHLYLPARRRSEALIYLDYPIVPADILGGKPAAPQTLAAAIQAACRENAFSLQPQDIEYLLSDLEEIQSNQQFRSSLGRSRNCSNRQQ